MQAPHSDSTDWHDGLTLWKVATLTLSESICSVATMDAKKAPQGFRMKALVQALLGCFSANTWLSIFYPWIYWVLTYLNRHG